MTVPFSNSRSKVPKYEISHFWSQLQPFLLFCEILKLDKFEGADFKYDNSFFKFQPKNIQIRHFWSQIQVYLFFHKILQLNKFEGADFKYDNSIFKNLARKYPNKTFLVKNIQIRHFWSKIQAFLFFPRNFAIRQVRGCSFQI